MPLIIRSISPKANFKTFFFQGGKMRSLLLGVLVLSCFSEIAMAGSCVEIKGGIVTVRESLIGMLKDKTKRTPEQKKIVKDSSDKVTTFIEQFSYAPEKKAEYDEMKQTWADFKKVREEQVVPLLEQGKDADAEKLVTGEQKERLMKVISLCEKIK